MPKALQSPSIGTKRDGSTAWRILLSMLSGLLLTLSFPPFHLSFLAWVAVVPLLIGTHNIPFFKAFKLGLLAGLTHYVTLTYWIVFALGHYGNLNLIAATGPFLLLCLYLSLFPAFFSAFASWLNRSPFYLLLLSSLWVALEFVRSFLLTGFPWCLLGYSQYRHLYMIQISDVVGVYGVSFLLISVNGLVRNFFLNTAEKAWRLLKLELPMVLLALVGTLVYGHSRLAVHKRLSPGGDRIKAAVVQANIDQAHKWDPAYQSETIETYERLTRSTIGFKPDLIVWPETAVPFFFQENSELSARVVHLAKESDAALIFGSPAYERSGAELHYYNRAYLVSPQEESLQSYDKVRLVPFGEYVPMRRFLFFINRLVPAAGDFRSGHEIRPLIYNGVSLGILICFEAIFPELARAHVRKGTNILVNLTNDAWFGRTSAPYQHLSMTIFRAVETRRPLIRAANTGFSAFIMPSGEVSEMSDLFTETVLKAPIKIVNAPLTFYTRHGDIFSTVLLVVAGIRILFQAIAKRRRRHESTQWLLRRHLLLCLLKKFD